MNDENFLELLSTLAPMTKDIILGDIGRARTAVEHDIAAEDDQDALKLLQKHLFVLILTTQLFDRAAQEEADLIKPVQS